MSDVMDTDNDSLPYTCCVIAFSFIPLRARMRRRVQVDSSNSELIGLVNRYEDVMVKKGK